MNLLLLYFFQGMWIKSRVWGWKMGAIFAAIGMFKKDSIQTNWRFFPAMETIPAAHGDYRRQKHDWTLFPEGERGWIAGTRIGDKAKN